MLHGALKAVTGGAALTRERCRAVFEHAVHDDTDPVALGGLLAALAARGETAEELAGAADALRGCMLPFEHDHPDAIDTAGTGGDGLATFNLSTAAAIVAAAAGARVIKHGNRKVSSACGSADLLECAGVPLELSPASARAVLDEVGITFLYAPAYHPALRAAAAVRRSLGVRTMLNLLGPLLNPGRVTRQVLGVGDGSSTALLAAALEELQPDRALVVHGAGGADELTLAGPNTVYGVGALAGRASGFDAADVKLNTAPVSSLAGGDATRNLQLLLDVLEGEPGPVADAVVLNAAAALVVAGVADDGADGVARAREAVRRGDADRTLRRWVVLARHLESIERRLGR